MVRVSVATPPPESPASPAPHRLPIGDPAAGVSTLRLDHGTLQASDSTTIQSRGRLAGTGTLVAGGPVANAGEIDLGSGGLQILGGPITNTGLIYGHGRIESALSNSAGGEVRADAGKRVLWGGVNNTNSGRFRLLGGTIEFEGSLTNTNAGVISGSGSLLVAAGTTNDGLMNFSATTHVGGDVTNLETGRIIVSGTGGTTFHDDVINDGEIAILEGSNATFFGSFSGAQGTTGGGTAFFSGDLDPGNSPAAIDFGGDVVFGPTSVPHIEIAGLPPVSGWNSLTAVMVPPKRLSRHALSS